MNEIVYKKIERKDEKQLRKLIKIVLDNLSNPDFFIPYAEWELEEIFNEEYAPLHGAYDGDKLVGMAQLYVKQDFLAEYKEVLGISNYKACELGGNLLLPEYRGKGIMLNLIKMQTKLAKEMGFDYIISMAHPDNIASKKNLEKVGLEFIKTETVNGTFLRDVYMKKI